MAQDRQSQGTGTKRFRCTHRGCQNSFAKAEHLARHVRTHSGSKPFVCVVCRRRFARNDSLVRHARLHAQGTAERSCRPSPTGPDDDCHGVFGPMYNLQEAPASPHGTRHGCLLDEAHSNKEVDHSGAVFAGLDSQSHVAHASTNDVQQTPAQDVLSAQLTESGFTATEASPWPTIQCSTPLHTVGDGGGALRENRSLWEFPFLQNSMSWDDILSSLGMEPFATNSQPPQSSSFPGTSPQYNLGNIIHPVSDKAVHSATHPSAEIICHAVSSLKDTIHSLPSRLTSEQVQDGIASCGSSLSLYLELFLARFPDILPVVHTATFNAAETAPSALLLMLALGTNYLGTPAAVSQGESLWTLAHAVATTSWSTLLTSRGPRDVCDGVQLVLTAVLGQTYAFMSANDKLRTTAQVAHDLGFHWARQCGMFDVEYGNITAAENSSSTQWKEWAAKETQLRAVLAHYILDGHIAQTSGGAVCVRHSINPLPMPSSNAAFAAPDPSTWQAEMAKNAHVEMTFRQYILALFRGNGCPPVPQPLPEISIWVVLECFQSFASERREADGDAVGLPSMRLTMDAMVRLYRYQIQGSLEEIQLAIRWHSILGYSMCTDARDVCYQLCMSTKTSQTIFPPRKCGPSSSNLDIKEWVESCEGRTAVLHSFAICHRIDVLPLSQAHGIQVPLAAFLAAIPLLAFLSTNTSTLNIPIEMDWDASGDLPSTSQLGDSLHLTNARLQTLDFVNGIGVSSDQALTCNLHVELHGLRRLLRTLSEMWGVCILMEATLKSIYEAITR